MLKTTLYYLIALKIPLSHKIYCDWWMSLDKVMSPDNGVIWISIINILSLRISLFLYIKYKIFCCNYIQLCIAWGLVKFSVEWQDRVCFRFLKSATPDPPSKMMYTNSFSLQYQHCDNIIFPAMFFSNILQTFNYHIQREITQTEKEAYRPGCV